MNRRAAARRGSGLSNDDESCYAGRDSPPGEAALVPAGSPEVERLLASRDAPSHDRAWEAFLAAYSRLMLRTAWQVCGDHDLAMDAYLAVLDALRGDGCRRLRAWADRGQGAFAPWLVVVTRRLCVDFLRHRYGRERGHPTESASPGLASRRRLADLVGAATDPDALAAPASADPAAALEARESAGALERALAALESRDRLLVRLHYEDGVSIPRAARLMAFPTPFHAYRRLRKVLAQLRESLRRGGVWGPDL